MKIGILAIGTRGDLQPCIALAKKLKSKNHNVIIAAYSKYRDFVINNNLDFIDIPNDPSENWDKSTWQREKVNIWAELYKQGKTWVDISLDNFKAIDVLLYTPLCFIGSSLAEKLDVPYFPIIFEPSISTKYFASPYSPFKNSRIKFINRLSFFLSDQSFYQPMKKNINKIRIESLNLDSFPFLGPYKKLIKNKVPFLCAYSSYLIPKPQDWNENISVTGYWFLENEKNFDLSESLKEFLIDNKQPIIVDLGSFSHNVILPQIQMVIDELSKLNYPILFYHGRLDYKKLNLPQKIFLLDSSIPHDLIFPYARGIITHGGVGVVHSAMKHGIPILPISFFGAQYFWGKRLYDLKLSSKPLRIRKFTREELKDSIIYAFNNAEISENTKNISQKILTENGAEKAIQSIEKFAGK